MRPLRANASAAGRFEVAARRDGAIWCAAGEGVGTTGSGVTEEELKKRLGALRVEHRDLDAAIAALTSIGGPDQVQVARLKKRKLQLKDQIAIIEDYLTPDIIA
jgi:hypothetical protein